MTRSTWIHVVLENYPKVFISPEREIAGLRNMVEQRAPDFAPAFRMAYKSKRKPGNAAFKETKRHK